MKDPDIKVAKVPVALILMAVKQLTHGHKNEALAEMLSNFALAEITLEELDELCRVADAGITIMAETRHTTEQILAKLNFKA